MPIRFAGWTKERITESTGKFPVEIDEWLEDMLTGKVIRDPGGLGTVGVGLLFDGGPGEGKTTHAAVAAMEFVRRLPDDEASARQILHTKVGEYGRALKVIQFLTFPEFLSLKKSAFDAEPDERRELHRVMEGLHGRAKEDWLNVRLLVVDDLGKEAGSRYEDTSFDELLRARYDKGLPTIITTNYMREDWAVQYGEAMGSFAYEAFHRVRIQNKDLRKRG
ncbi:DnaC DNA replication protein [uncultured Caudovirales phage]|uniref:DnaC DNA replication protein n=1 Tax=uncultured Caudovirales phage TaxID=2100421 RepID=A0A6J5KUW8_9CAUD|nr:DnaC DNA replication protein [uncultured Caudovirales phage]